MNERARVLLALSHLPRVGRASVKPVLARLKSHGVDGPSLAEAISWLTRPAFSPAQIDAATAHADQIVAECLNLGSAVHAYGSSSYPAQLERLAQPPAVLFARGRFESALAPRIAVVGTRKPTPWGAKTAKACAHQVVAMKGAVVSGLAVGIDSAAHQAAIDGDGATWAVLPHGLAAPAATAAQRGLADRILAAGGALLSEFPPHTRAERHHFVERDRIQAGLSDAVLLVESEPEGGAMHTVRFAQQALVPVWATLPSAALNSDRDRLPTAQRGPWELLQQGSAMHVPSTKALERMVRNLA